jgi:uncharacterized membrane protein
VINHVRTLLVNQDGHGSLPGAGEEYTPPTYKQVTLTDSLQKLRAVLFGTAPDRQMLLYRTRQFLAILHSTPLADFVVSDDTRLTYTLDVEPGLVPALTVSDPGYPLYVSGDKPRTASGQMSHTWVITVAT